MTCDKSVSIAVLTINSTATAKPAFCFCFRCRLSTSRVPMTLGWMMHQPEPSRTYSIAAFAFVRPIRAPCYRPVLTVTIAVATRRFASHRSKNSPDETVLQAEAIRPLFHNSTQLSSPSLLQIANSHREKYFKSCSTAWFRASGPTSLSPPAALLERREMSDQVQRHRLAQQANLHGSGGSTGSGTLPESVFKAAVITNVDELHNTRALVAVMFDFDLGMRCGFL